MYYLEGLGEGLVFSGRPIIGEDPEGTGYTPTFTPINAGRLS
jgi:hypothetical protein